MIGRLGFPEHTKKPGIRKGTGHRMQNTMKENPVWMMQQMQNSLRSHCKANKAIDATCGGNTVSPKNQWEFQDPKMEVLYGTVPYKAIFCGDIHLHMPYIGLIW